MSITLCLIFILLSAILTKIFCFFSQNSKLIDNPNDRSLHSCPTVRGGGLVFIALSLVSLPFLCYFYQISFVEHLILGLCIVLLAVISFLDDIYHLSVKPRFLVQCFIALIIALFMTPEILDFGLFKIQYKIFIVPFLFFSLIWSINHFNFMDGLDGFCASQAIFLFSAYALLFNLHHALMYQDFCLVLVSSLIGFLIFNFPPAKLFMGDIGSATLGLITFALAVIGQQKYQIPIVYWFILNGLFLFDSTLTLFRRILKKEKWSSPHRKHAYQRLKQLGVNNRVILLGQMLLNGLFFVLVLSVNMNTVNLILALIAQLMIVLVLYLIIEKSFPMFE